MKFSLQNQVLHHSNVDSYTTSWTGNLERGLNKFHNFKNFLDEINSNPNTLLKNQGFPQNLFITRMILLKKKNQFYSKTEF